MTSESAVPPPHDPADIERLDRAFLRVRRMMVKPAGATLPIPSLGRPVDMAKAMACLAIAELTEDSVAGQQPTVKDLATVLELDHSTASRLLTEAEAEGLLIRGTDPTDRRRTTVELTDLGRSVVADSTATRNWVIGQVVAEWEPADLATLTSLLERITNTFATRLPDVMCEAHGKFDNQTGNLTPPVESS